MSVRQTHVPEENFHVGVFILMCAAEKHPQHREALMESTMKQADSLARVFIDNPEFDLEKQSPLFPRA